jgi:hypothetical protein
MRTLAPFLLLVFPGVILQGAGSKADDWIQICAGAALQGVGLVLYLRAKGRSSWWALFALIPLFGWIGPVALRSQAQLAEIAKVKTAGSKPQRSRKVASAAALMLVAGFCAGPRAALFDVHQEGHRLVQALGDYKRSFGSYPAALGELGVPLKYPSEGWRGISYRPTEGSNHFLLTCFVNRFATTAERVTYDSRTEKWRSYR